MKISSLCTITLYYIPHRFYQNQCELSWNSSFTPLLSCYIQLNANSIYQCATHRHMHTNADTNLFTQIRVWVGYIKYTYICYCYYYYYWLAWFRWESFARSSHFRFCPFVFHLHSIAFPRCVSVLHSNEYNDGTWRPIYSI